MTRRSTTTKTPSSQRLLRLGLWRSLQLVLLVVVMRNPKDPAGVVEAWCSASRSRSRNSIRIPLRQLQQRRQHWQRSATPTSSQPRSIIMNARSDEYEDDDDDEEPPEVGDVQTFLQQHQQHRNPSSPSTTAVFGLNRGRSSPSHRQAVGKSGVARVYLCTNCGSESIQWLGRCPTCQEWNTLQEHAVVRRTTKNPTAAAAMRPLFGSSASSSSSSWLDHLVPYSSGAADPEQNMFLGDGAPVRVTDLIQQNNNNNSTKSNSRIVIPEDPEFNRVLGGGIVPGSLILVGGDPGVGKSTLLLQAAGQIAASTAPSSRPGIGMGLPNNHDNNATAAEPAVVVWYVSGEETPAQVADRAQRLGLANAEDLYLLRETHVDTLCAQIVAAQQQQQQQQQYNSRRNTDRDMNDDDDDASFQQHQHQIRPPSLIILDSIQTLHCDSAQHAAPGGVTQVRECVALLLRLAKSTHTAVWLVGHVTKTGDVAGPRTVEHMVDAVLYLEHAGSSSGSSSEGGLRILRASKNRFGPADDNVGVYEIVSGSGRLRPVSDPSALFMAQRQQHSNEDVEGSAVAIVLEGRRAVAVEVQALVTWAAANAGRRTVHGLTTSRLLLLLGVLQKRCGMIGFGRQDVYVNVVGSTSTMTSTQQQQQHAADLAVAVALASSLHQIAVRSDTAFVGQVGLLGELRTVPRLEQRLQEAQRMGFSRVVTPRDVAGNSKSRKTKTSSSKIHISRIHGMDWIQCDTLQVAINEGLVDVIPKHKRKRRAGITQNQSKDSDLLEIMDDQDDADDDPIDSGFG